MHKIIHNILHIILLFLLSMFAYVYVVQPSFIKTSAFLVGFINVIKNIEFLTNFIPYVSLLRGKSYDLLTIGYVEIQYILMVLVFVNLFIYVLCLPKNIKGKFYRLDYCGYSKFMDDNVYSMLFPSISLHSYKQKSHVASPIIQETGFNKLMLVFFKQYFAFGYLFMFVIGFVLFPYMLYSEIGVVFPLKIKVAIYAFVLSYVQARFVFELVICALSYFKIFEEEDA